MSESKERSEWPKKFKNSLQLPLSIDMDTHGAISIGGKGTVWLWSADFAAQGVQHHIQNGTLIPWDDGESQPDMPSKVQGVTVERHLLDASPHLLDGVDIGTLGRVVTEEGRDELPPVSFTPPETVSGGDKAADSGPKKKRG